jgi:hypothetical protein
MSKITNPLLFEGSTKPKVLVQFPNDENKPDYLELTLQARFNQTLAKALDCGHLFTKNGSIVSNFKEHKLDTEFTDVQLKLIGKDGDLDAFSPESCDKFVIKHSGEEGTTITLRVSMEGHFDPFIEFFRANRLTGFSFEIAARQAELFEGGDRVDLSETKEETVVQ